MEPCLEQIIGLCLDCGFLVETLDSLAFVFLLVTCQSLKETLPMSFPTSPKSLRRETHETLRSQPGRDASDSCWSMEPGKSPSA